MLDTLDDLRKSFNDNSHGGKKVSLADLVVLAGSAAIEAAAKQAGHEVIVPFTPGRMDASLEQTDVDSFLVLEPALDGFRNYARKGSEAAAAATMVDRANLLMLSAPEMTVLVGGLRAMGANFGGTSHGVFTDRPGALTPDFFRNPLDMCTAWKRSETDEHVFEGRDRSTDALKWTATLADLVFGSNAQLRALSEV